jgi:hypothetical protein
MDRVWSSRGRESRAELGSRKLSARGGGFLYEGCHCLWLRDVHGVTRRNLGWDSH